MPTQVLPLQVKIEDLETEKKSSSKPRKDDSAGLRGRLESLAAKHAALQAEHARLQQAQQKAQASRPARSEATQTCDGGPPRHMASSSDEQPAVTSAAACAPPASGTQPAAVPSTSKAAAANVGVRSHYVDAESRELESLTAESSEHEAPATHAQAPPGKAAPHNDAAAEDRQAPSSGSAVAQAPEAAPAAPPVAAAAASERRPLSLGNAADLRAALSVAAQESSAPSSVPESAPPVAAAPVAIDVADQSLLSMAARSSAWDNATRSRIALPASRRRRTLSPGFTARSLDSALAGRANASEKLPTLPSVAESPPRDARELRLRPADGPVVTPPLFTSAQRQESRGDEHKTPGGTYKTPAALGVDICAGA
jgi:hypothetical protein